MEDDASSTPDSASISVDFSNTSSTPPRKFTHILERGLSSIESTPSPLPAKVSPPRLMRNDPGSNIWHHREDGTIANGVSPLPISRRLFTEPYDENDHIRFLEEGISQGRVNVRPSDVNMAALEEGITQGRVNTIRGSR